jgi:hypothetical protein
MPYHPEIKLEAQLANSSAQAREERFYAIYIDILTYWFPSTHGYHIDPQTSINGHGGKPDYILVRNAFGHRNPLLVVEIKRPSKWTEGGKAQVVRELEYYMEQCFDVTQHDTIYGLGGIGLHWMLCKMTTMGGPESEIVVDWLDNIASDDSYDVFRDHVAQRVYNIE